MNPLTTALPKNYIPDPDYPQSSPLLVPPPTIAASSAHSPAAVQPASPADAPPKPKGKNVRITLAPPSHRPPGYLPPEIALQSITAHQAFTLLCINPHRSLRSIAREIGVAHSTLQTLSIAGRWALHLGQFVAKSAESLNSAAREEAHRSRLELLESNVVRQAVLDAAALDLVTTDAVGNATLKPGKTMREVASFQAAVANHVKTTQLLTGEDAANRRSAAAAGAPKIVINTRDMMPEPLPAAAHVVSSDGHPV